jgi:uncharacterized membrane protein YphA (DoxX/SURF4 family)
MERENVSHAPGLQLLRPEFRDITMAAPAPNSALPTAILRVILGLAWTANAALKWFPAFGAAFLPMLTGASQDQPGFLKPWFNLVTAVASDGRAPFLALGSAVMETYLAVALLTGFARKTTYAVGAIYTAMIWATAEGFGGPYVPGISTDVGAAIISSLLFLMLLINDAGAGFSRFSLDSLLERRIPRWRRVAELDWLGSQVGGVADQ